MTASDLERFVAAQDGAWAAARAELQAGAKTGHWIWFVFPQVAGLGRSDTARRYALDSRDEARAYLAHPILGARLREATRLMLRHRPRSAEVILGPLDALKFRSSMTLFAAAAPEEELFAEALAAFCDGAADPMTLALLGEE